MSLTSSEINQLIEALQVWEKEPSTNELQGSMFGLLLAGVGASSEEESKQRHEAARRKSEMAMAKAKQDCQIRREQSILLQAKLLLMRNEALKAEIT